MQKSEPVSLTLSKDQALVFFEWIANFNRTGDAQFAHPAERRVLFYIEGLLEEQLAEPFRADYSELLEAAREALRGEDLADDELS